MALIFEYPELFGYKVLLSKLNSPTFIWSLTSSSEIAAKEYSSLSSFSFKEEAPLSLFSLDSLLFAEVSGLTVSSLPGVASSVSSLAGVASSVSSLAGVASSVSSLAGVASSVSSLAGVASSLFSDWFILSSATGLSLLLLDSSLTLNSSDWLFTTWLLSLLFCSSAFASLPIPNNKAEPTKIEAVPTVNFLIEYLLYLFGIKSIFLLPCFLLFFIFIPPNMHWKIKWLNIKF